MATVPSFVHTPIEEIAPAHKRVHDAFSSQVTKPVEYRLAQLRKLYWSIEDNTDALVEAFKRDLGKPVTETFLSEIDFVKNEIVTASNRLPRWMKDEAVPDVPLDLKLTSPRIRKEPYGAVLIIGAFNFPFNLVFIPLIGAIAAGCTAVVKPAEGAPNVAAVAQLLMKALDQSCYACIQGGVPETTALLNRPWDKIFYTGGQAVAKIVARAAAEHLTPLTLELGGRNPSYVTSKADVRMTAHRLLWAKTMNAGQSCISPNYVLTERDTAPKLLQELKQAYKEFYPDGARASEDYARIATPKHWAHLKRLLDTTDGEIVLGGSMDENTRFLEPTVVRVASPADALVQEENFGPILTVLPVDSLDEALRITNGVDPTPLSLSVFGAAGEAAAVQGRQRSGGASHNDPMWHAVLPGAPFGGVGTSGQGAYRGRNSFDCFSHRRALAAVPGWMESMLSIRYPPFTESKKKQIKARALKPNFDREGRVTGSWLWRLVGVGGIGALLVAFGIKQYLDQQAGR